MNNTFEIKSWVLGTERKIIVTEPLTVDGTEFKLELDEKEPLIIKYDNGHWHPLSPDDKTVVAVPRQLEIDSIGFEIAKHWCSRLARQLENFQLAI
ncbi:hypothetical protein [Mucilaginibacter sp.]|uniref:hypothetical protein n=1 Tax=Mucilaginibacter sp. TaxID=1882438 RepID=UPI002ED34953